MACRNFAGGGVVRTALGGADTAAGAAMTYVALVKFAATEASQWLIARNVAGHNNAGQCTSLGREPEIHLYPTGQDAGFTPPTNEWVLVVASKAAGSTKANYHYYRFSTGTWFSGESTNAFTTIRAVVPVEFQFGRYNGVGSEQFLGLYAAASVFGTALSKPEAEALAAVSSIKGGWLAKGPLGLWTFDQQSTSEPVNDLTGLGADQISFEGTTVSIEEPPIPYAISAEPLDARVTREAPQDLNRLAMVIERPGGIVKRWADDEPDVENIPVDLTVSSSLPGGDADVGCGLLRELAYRDPDLRNRNRVRIQGPGADDVWSGYLAKTPATRKQVTPAAVGDVGKLRGDASLRMIPVDRDLSHWVGGSNARRIQLIGLNVPIKADAEVVQDPNGQALVFTLTDGWVAPNVPRVEAWYDAGQGLKLGRLYFKWTGDSNTTFELERYARPSDTALVAESEGVADLYTAAAGTDDFKPSSERQYFSLGWHYNASPAGAEGAAYRLSLTELAVYGRDVPQVPNPGGGPPGVLGPDVLKAILAKAGNGITWDDSNPLDDFVIPHLVWLDAVNPEQAILDVNRYYRNLWGIFGGKLRWGPPETFGRLWHVRRDEGADPDFNGPDSDQEFNGQIVRYDDVLTGTRRLVGPPSSGYVGPSSLSTAGLVDLDPYLPLNEWSERKYAELEAGRTSEAGAIRLGELFGQGLRSRLTSGSIEIGPMQVFDATGARYPAWAPTAGDRLVVDDEPGQPERLIVDASYAHATERATLTLDSPPNALEAIQERLQVVLVGIDG